MKLVSLVNASVKGGFSGNKDMLIVMNQVDLNEVKSNIQQELTAHINTFYFTQVTVVDD